ncbi:alr0857 family protein [Pleurocapsa sp. PCC 7319]|uniref:alr0857 family protein n=1 Tax=Pleurocapsa sp. PCC 7319 TaxID=118161 RepID=UPI0003474CD7|nr:alr0857 family protein [Pleurocapsa sp. PCC 7319]
MLKITYLEEEIYLEYLQESVEAWKASRVLVSLRAAASIYIEPSTACLIFPVNIPYLSGWSELEVRANVEITICDEEYIEVSLSGTWVSMSEESEEGVFVCDLNQRNEYFLYQLWQESQIGSSVMSE